MGRDIYISHKRTVGVAVAENVRLQVAEDEAEKIVEVRILLRKYIFQPQAPFSGSFNSSSLSEPVPKPLLIILNVLLQGSNSTEDKMAEDHARKHQYQSESQLHHLSTDM